MCVDMLFDLSVPPGAWKMGCLSWRVWMNSGNNDNYCRLPASIAFPPRLIFLFKEESCIEILTMIFRLIRQIFETCKGVQYKILIEIRELWEIISECLLAGVVVVMPCVLYAFTMLGKLCSLAEYQISPIRNRERAAFIQQSSLVTPKIWSQHLNFISKYITLIKIQVRFLYWRKNSFLDTAFIYFIKGS